MRTYGAWNMTARDSNRRLLSGICGAFLLVSLLLSSLFVIVEADHDCSGERDCPVCLQLQACLDGYQQTGLLPRLGSAAVRADETSFVRTNPPDRRAAVLTLHSIDVRFDE